MLLPCKRLAPALLLLALAGCSKVNDMHDATMAMQKKTGEMASTTDQMHAVMEQILDTGRMGASLDLRNKLFKLAHDAPKLEDKGTDTGLYFQAFEFQLWTILNAGDGLAVRDRLMQDAAEEFIRRLVGISHWTDVDPFAGKNPLTFGETENERATFNALAASLHEVNRKQDEVDSGSDEISMRNMVETALRAGKSIREGKSRLSDYPGWVAKILVREDLATRLEEARYQVMGLAVLGLLTPITENLTTGLEYKVLGFSWDLDFSKLNQALTNECNFRLREAIRARNLLAEIGRPVELNGSVAKIFSHAKLKNAGNLDAKLAPSAELADQATAETNFLKAFADYSGTDLLKEDTQTEDAPVTAPM